jgi:hypothetical protein
MEEGLSEDWIGEGGGKRVGDEKKEEGKATREGGGAAQAGECTAQAS